jgi:hypothetical protein
MKNISLVCLLMIVVPMTSSAYAGDEDKDSNKAPSVKKWDFQKSGRGSLEELPIELVYKVIFDNLEAKDLLSVQQTCQDMHSLTQEPSIQAKIEQERKAYLTSKFKEDLASLVKKDPEYYNVLSERIFISPSKKEQQLMMVVKRALNAENLDQQDENGRTPLVDATELIVHQIPFNPKAIEIVRLLLKYGANPNIQDQNGLTALHLATEANHSVPKNDLVDPLLSAGADVNLVENAKQSALHLAIFHRGSDKDGKELLIIKKLLAAGANPNLQDNIGYSSLHSAVKLNDTKAVKLLLAAGVDINLKRDDGKTALDIAIEMKRRDAIINMLGAAELAETGMVPPMNFEKHNSEQLSKRSALPLKAIVLKSIIGSKYSPKKPVPELVPDEDN